MHHLRRRLLALALGALVAVAARETAADAGPLRVGVLRSAASLRVSGWVGAWETDGSIACLRSLGLDVRVLYDRDLTEGALDDLDVLVVPNARCIATKAIERVNAWVRDAGGRLLATGMASYRDDKNRRVTPDNNFQWARLYGADFQRWLGAWPNCEYLELDRRLATEVGVVMRGPSVPRVQLGRNTAMLVRAREGSKVLATWLNADEKTPTTDSGSAGAAIVQSGRVIYCGENLLAPELSRSPQVMGLVLALLRRLDGDAPMYVPEALLRERPRFRFPKGPTVSLAPGGPPLRVGVHSSLAVVGVGSQSGLRVESDPPDVENRTPVPVRSAAGQMLEIRPVGAHPDAARGFGFHVRDGDTVSPMPARLRIESRDPHHPVQLLQLRPNGTCKAQAFRGTVELTAHGDTMSVVNVLSAEEYTAGVVPNETPAVYPQEALRTMAVIARTFGLSRRGYHKAKGFDVCNTVDCQVYGGFLTEWDSANHAVNATRNDVIEYEGRLADSTFHAVCGGVGEDVERVWPQPPSPFLVGGPDGPAPLPDLSSEEAFTAFLEQPPDCYCSASPRFRWRETYTLPQLQDLFEKSLPVTLPGAFHGLGTLRAVRVLERSLHGRVLKLGIEGTDGTYVVEKDRIRWLWSGGLVGQGGLQSTLFRIVPQTDGALLFAGGGWGHGVGMCQEGAAGMATRGQNYRAIIEHYYPHTMVAPLKSQEVDGR